MKVFNVIKQTGLMCKIRYILRNMYSANAESSLETIKQAFFASVNAVQPGVLIKANISRNGNTLKIRNYQHSLEGGNVHIVGFGKAVLGMVSPLENLLRNSDGTVCLRQGIVIIPVGTCDTLLNRKHLLPPVGSAIRVFEGAKNNIPDTAAYNATLEIIELVKGIPDDDLLVVLISGGGSALLPAPLPPLTLAEKGKVTNDLSKAGATISEINTVRKFFSAIKGGKLVGMTKASVVGLIISDVIDSPLDIIASGPTVPSGEVTLDLAKNILEKYGINLSESLLSALSNHEANNSQESCDFSRVHNFIIGDNNVALEAAKSHLSASLSSSGCSEILTTRLKGEANLIGENLAQLVAAIVAKQCVELSKDLFPHPDTVIDIPLSLLKQLSVEDRMAEALQIMATHSVKVHQPLVLIFGGETTVHVKGSGVGGRNQEMAMAFSLHFNKLQSTIKNFRGRVTFLSAGTDGIDGPTPSAGAVTWFANGPDGIRSQLLEAKYASLDTASYLQNNDSHSYFKLLREGHYLVNTGHTGTNVMDIQIIFIELEYIFN